MGGLGMPRHIILLQVIFVRAQISPGRCARDWFFFHTAARPLELKANLCIQMQCSELTRVALKGVFARKQLNKIGAKPFKIQRWEKPFFYYKFRACVESPSLFPGNSQHTTAYKSISVHEHNEQTRPPRTNEPRGRSGIELNRQLGPIQKKWFSGLVTKTLKARAASAGFAYSRTCLKFTL